MSHPKHHRLLLPLFLACLLHFPGAGTTAFGKLEMPELSEKDEAAQDEALTLKWLPAGCARLKWEEWRVNAFARYQVAAHEMAEAGKTAEAAAYTDRLGRRFPIFRWTYACDLAEGFPYEENLPRALEEFAKAGMESTVRPNLPEFCTWLETAAKAGGPGDFHVIDSWIQRPEFTHERFRRPLPFDGHTRTENYAKAVAKAALQSLERGCVDSAHPTPTELERASRLVLLAIQLGSDQALDFIDDPRFQELPRFDIRLARALLDASTLNLRLALPRLKRHADDKEAAALLAHWVNPKTGEPTARARRVEERLKELDLGERHLEQEFQAYATGGGTLDHGWLTFEQAHLTRAALRGDTEARDLLLSEHQFQPNLIDRTPDEWVAQTNAQLEAYDVDGLWYAVNEAGEVWRQGELFWYEHSPGWKAAVGLFTELGIQLMEQQPPPGSSMDLLEPLLEVGLLDGHADALEKLADLKLANSDAVGFVATHQKLEEILTELSRKVLQINLCNAMYVRHTLRERFSDEWKAVHVLQEFGILKEDGRSLTALGEYVEAVATARAKEEKRGDPTKCLFPLERRYRFGSAGEALFREFGWDMSPGALAVIEELGLPRFEPKAYELR